MLYAVLSGGTYTPKVWVSKDTQGIPRLIPSKLRRVVLNSRSVFVGVSTLLALFRVLPWWPSISYSTITSGFTGLTRTLPTLALVEGWMKLNRLALVSLHFKLHIKASRFLRVESSSPNYLKGLFMMWYDAYAFYHHPMKLLSLSKWLFYFGSYHVIIVLYGILLLGLLFYPLIICCRFLDTLFFGHLDRKHINLGRRSCLGRLTTVLDQAGKTRVIAITNYWIQVALKPLHDSVFDYLDRLPTDGTYDQLKPILELVRSQGIGVLYSLDLTAATDRLPIEVQRDILSIYTNKYVADLWVNLMRIPFVDIIGNTCITYAVGQPMGAYSSWAMLALTHHLIVQAATPGGVNNFYSVLGDDGVVSGSEVSDCYQSFMSILGVPINLMKSMISSNFVEFAKRVIDIQANDWSCIGPGLIVAAIRNPLLKGSLLVLACQRQLISFATAVDKLRWLRGNHLDFGLYLMFGFKGVITKDHLLAPIGGMRWLSFRDPVPLNMIEYICRNALLQLQIDKYRRSVMSGRDMLLIWKAHFMRFFHDSRVYPIQAVIAALASLFTPAPFMLWSDLVETSYLQTFPQQAPIGDLLDNLVNIQVPSSPPRRKEIVDIMRRYRELDRCIQTTYTDMILIEGDLY